MRQSRHDVFSSYDPVPVLVTIDSLEDNSGETAVEDLWRRDENALQGQYSTHNQGKKPVVEVEFIVPPGDDY
jgi:hypothetical protein